LHNLVYRYGLTAVQLVPVVAARAVSHGNASASAADGGLFSSGGDNRHYRLWLHLAMGSGLLPFDTALTVTASSSIKRKGGIRRPFCM